MFIGDIEVIFCEDFETSDPFENDVWFHDLQSGSSNPGADDWQWGTPQAIPYSQDPSFAYSGDNVIGNDLGLDNGNGRYQNNKVNFVLSPPIDTMGYDNVRAAVPPLATGRRRLLRSCEHPQQRRDVVVELRQPTG